MDPQPRPRVQLLTRGQVKEFPHSKNLTPKLYRFIQKILPRDNPAAATYLVGGGSWVLLVIEALRDNARQESCESE